MSLSKKLDRLSEASPVTLSAADERSAKQAYKKRQAGIDRMIKNIIKALADHEKSFNKNTWNYGYVGDLDRIYSLVFDAYNTLTSGWK